MKVEMHEWQTVVSPEPLETTGLYCCIGVAVIYQGRGFMLHSPDIIVEQEEVIDPFFEAIERYIPLPSRSTTIPIVGGGHIDPTDAAEIQESTHACRSLLESKLKHAGFLLSGIRWAKRHQSHSLYIDTVRQRILRRTEEIETFLH